MVAVRFIEILRLSGHQEIRMEDNRKSGYQEKQNKILII